MKRALGKIAVALLWMTVISGTASGQSWVSNGPYGGSISVLAVDPITPTTLYAGTAGSGIYKSINGGASWTAINNGLWSLAVWGLAINPATPTTLYAAAINGFTFAIFKSSDGGGSWSTVTLSVGQWLSAGSFASAAIGFPTISFVIDPVTPTTLYLVSGGIFKSTDGGVNWKAANSGLPIIVGVGYVNEPVVAALTIDPAKEGTLYAAATSSAGTLSVFKSTDGAATWKEANSGLPSNQEVIEFAIDPATPTTLYVTESPSLLNGLAGAAGAGVFKSIDGSASWNAVNTGLTTLNTYNLAIDPATPSTLYVGAYGGGVFKSTDGAASWSAVTNLDPFVNLFFLAKNPAAPSTLYAGTAGAGVVKSADGGASWVPANFGLIGTVVGSLAIDPVTPTTLYAGRVSPTGILTPSFFHGGVSKSTDGGKSWSDASNGVPVNVINVSSLAIDPSTPTTLYAGINGGATLLKSTDGAQSWTFAGGGLIYQVNALAIDPKTPTNLYAATAGGVFKSTDGAASWSAFNNGLNVQCISSLAIDPMTPSTLYAGTCSGSGVFKSTNGGGSWSAANSGLPQPLGVPALAVDPATPTNIYAGTYAGVFKSTDGGGTWSNVNSNGAVTALALDPVAPGTLYVGLASNGLTPVIFESNDGGATWSGISSGLTAGRILTLSIDSKGSNVFAGTFAGVFSTTVRQTIPASATTLASSLNPSVVGESVTFTATVISSSGIPTGTVAFIPPSNGSCPPCLQTGFGVGTATLDASGVASLTQSPLSVVLWDGSSTAAGTYNVTAVYLGSPSFASSSSPSLTQIVTPPLLPRIIDISPMSAPAGGAAFTLFVNGTGFVSTAVVNFGANARATTFLNADQLEAAILATDIATVGTFNVTVTNPVPGGGTSNAVSFTVNNPVLAITSIAPASATAGGAAFTLTVNGTNFVSGSTISFNGIARATTFVSATQLTAAILATDIATVGTFNVTVTNPSPGGGTSNAVSFTVNNPVPAITSFAPTTLTFGAQAIGTTSAAQTETVTNTGTASLTISTVTIGGTNPGDFTKGSDTCSGAIVVPNNTCTVSVTFTPSATGSRSASLNFADNASNNPQSVSLSGTGQQAPSFTLNGAAASAFAGGPGISTITLTPSGGFAGQVTVTCPAASSPPGVTCNSLIITLNGSAPVTGQLTLNVAAPSGAGTTAEVVPTSRVEYAGVDRPPIGRSGWWKLSAGTGLAAIFLFVVPGRRRYRATLGLSLMCVLSFALGCGGGSSSGSVVSGPLATIAKITAPQTKAAAGTSLNFNIAITSASSGTPAGNGMVQLFEGTAALGSPAQVTNGAATISVNSPASPMVVGTHQQISAHYLGGSSTQASQSGAVSVTVTGTTTVVIATNPASSNSNATINLTVN